MVICVKMSNTDLNQKLILFIKYFSKIIDILKITLEQ